MRCRVILTADGRLDSRKEIEKEVEILRKITGEDGNAEYAKGERNGKCLVFEMEFYEFYRKLKDEIMERLETYK